MFDGFARETIKTSGADINLVHGGSGPPVLLLHGSPQTHAVWHGLAPTLAESHTVVAADLRGYGDSSKPAGGGDHSKYSFRAMAADQLEAMRALGHERFAVVGHDRGARVAHRMARDHPRAVERVAFLDIVPTDYVYAHVDRSAAAAFWHWFFLTLPEPIPERMIEPAAMTRTIVIARSGARCFCCGGARGVVGTLYDPIEVWRPYAADVRGQALDAGHFLADERPLETLAALRVP
jgi:haloacetate dehalogenase